MDIYGIISIGLIGTFLTVILKQYKAEYALITGIVTAAIIFFAFIGQATLIIEEIKEFISNTEISDSNISVLIKALGICFITQFASDVCKDAGQNAIAGKIEAFGRAAMCISAIPLYRELLKIAMSIIGKVN